MEKEQEMANFWGKINKVAHRFARVFFGVLVFVSIFFVTERADAYCAGTFYNTTSYQGDALMTTYNGNIPHCNSEYYMYFTHPETGSTRYGFAYCNQCEAGYYGYEYPWDFNLDSEDCSTSGITSCFKCNEPFTNTCSVSHGTGTQTCYHTQSAAGSTDSSDCYGTSNCSSCCATSCDSGYSVENCECVADCGAEDCPVGYRAGVGQYNSCNTTAEDACYKNCSAQCSGNDTGSCPSHATSCTYNTSYQVPGRQYYGSSCDASGLCPVDVITCAAGYAVVNDECEVCDFYWPIGMTESCSCSGSCSVSNGSCSWVANSGEKYCLGHYTGGTGGSGGPHDGQCTGCSEWDACTGCDISVSCSSGYYLTNNNECESCPSGCTCSGGTSQPNCSVSCDEDQYLDDGECYDCPNEFPYSSGGSNGWDYCYRDCVPSDIAHASVVSGVYYWDDYNACTVTGCESGYYKYRPNNWTAYSCADCPSGCTCAGGTAQPVCGASCSNGQYVNGNSCGNCTNKPAHSTYTGVGTTATNCPWSCDSGYHESNGTCVQDSASSCSGATYYDSSAGKCVPCPIGYDYNTTAGKTSVSQCQTHCDGGTYVSTSGPDGYTELEYIASTGTQYINTGYSPASSTFSGAVEVQPVTSKDSVDFVRVGTMSVGWNTAYNGFLIWLDSLNTTTVTQSSSLTNGTRYIIGYSKSSSNTTLTINGTTTTGSTGSFTTGPLLLFQNDSTTNFTGRIYKSVFYDGGNLALNLIPARRNSDSVLGMYDAVSGNFYTNAGSGTFGYGSASPSRQCIDAGAGYYSSAATINYGSNGTRGQCTGLPTNAHWTGSGTTATNCPWECDSGYEGSSANGDTECSDDVSVFYITTTSNATRLNFDFRTAGTYTVDCDGGSLGRISGSSTNCLVTSDNTIQTRSSSTTCVYGCSWNSAGAHTVTIGGTTTGYNITNTGSNSCTYPTFRINSSYAQYVAAVGGNMSRVFPYLTGNAIYNAAQPRFCHAFQNCTNLTTISDGLFRDYTKAANNSFHDIFNGCSSLTAIPPHLFSGITEASGYAFCGAFMGCSSVPSIPSTLWSGLTTISGGSAAYRAGVFQGTFRDMTSVTTMPEDLFAGVSAANPNQFEMTFDGCSNMGSYIPPSTFGGLVAAGSPQDNTMWYHTFYNTQLLTACPAGTIQFITQYEGDNDTINWGGKVSCEPCPTGYIPNNNQSSCVAGTSTVTLNKNTSSNDNTTVATVTATYDAAMPLKNTSNANLTVPTRTGYTFAGYYDARTDGTQYYTAALASARNWDKTGAQTLYAQWTAQTSTVTLNANGGTDGATTSVTATYDSAMPGIPVANLPTRTGYTFTGFYDTNAATGGTQYYTSDGASARTWNKTGAQTLYARWTANTYTITLDDATNGGTGGSGTAKEVYNTKWTNSGGTTITSVTIPTKGSGASSAVFMGYYDAASGGNQKIPATGVLPATTTFTADTTLKAQFATCTCTSGTNVASCTVTGVSSNKCTYSYTCNDGYHVGSSGTTATGTFTATNAATASNTSPNCSGNTITLTWANGGHGTAPTSPSSCTYGGTFTTAAAITGVTGYTFNNWSVNSKTFGAAAANTACNYTNLGVYSGTATITATWTAQTSTVTLNKNTSSSDTTTVATVTATYDAAMPTKDTSNANLTVPTRTGYTFAGYYDARTGGTQYYTAALASAKTWDKTGAQTLYAQWTATTSTVTLNKNTSSTDTTTVATVTATYDAAMPTKDTSNANLAVPTRTAANNTTYAFNGYYDARTGGTKYYNADLSSAKNWDKTGAQTLYAQWTMTCDAGYYLPANSLACDACPDGSYCAGGTAYSYSASAQGKNSCTAVSSYATSYTHSGTSTTDSIARNAANDCYMVPDAGKYVATASRSTQTACTAGAYCPGDVPVYWGTTGGRLGCNTGTTSGVTTTTPWTSAASATARTSCYRNVILNKNGMSSGSSTSLTLPSGSGCKSLGTGTKTTNQTLVVYYDTTCTLPTGALSGSATGTTYTGTTTWATSANASSGFLTSIKVTSTDATVTYYAGKQYKCSAGYYLPANTNGACVLCEDGDYCPAMSSEVYYSTSAQGNNSCTATAPAAYSHSNKSAADTIARNAVDDCYMLSTAGKYVATANSVTETTCPKSFYCPGNIEIYYGTSDGQRNCNTGTAAGTAETPWTTVGTGSTLRSQCYRSVTLNKNLMSGTLTLPANSGCKSLAANEGTDPAVLEVWYGETCNLPTTILTRDGSGTTAALTSTGQWGGANTTASGFVTSIASTNTTAETLTYYADKKMTCDPGYYLAAKATSACTACTANYWCEGVSGYYSTSLRGRTGQCASAIATGWISKAGQSSKNGCYYPITVNKNGYSFTINAGTFNSETRNCIIDAAKSGTTAAVLRLYWNADCTLPSVGNRAQTGYTNGTAWAASSAIDAPTITTLAKVSDASVPEITTIYVQKPSCAANYYKSAESTCSLCSGVGDGGYNKSVAGNKTDEKVCYAAVTINKNNYSGSIEAPSNSGCEIDTNSGTTNATLHLHYNTACTLPTIAQTAQTLYTFEGLATSANIGASAVSTSIAASTEDPTITTYYVRKINCSANAYKSGDAACTACPTAYPNSAAGTDGQTACYANVTLNKNGYSGTLTAGTGTGCSVAETKTGTSNGTLKVYYNTACTLPTISGFTQTGYTNSSAWSSENTVGGAVISGLSASTSAPASTIYVQKTSCSANYYKSATTTCSTCPTAYPKSDAGNNSDQKVCYANITLNKNGYSGAVTAPSNSGCEVETNTGQNNATLHLHYNTACTLPTTTLTQTGYADTTTWATTNTIGASAVSSIGASTSAPSVATYYARKPGCVSPYYKSSTTACSACSSLTTPSSGWVTGGTYSSVSPYDANTTCRYKVADMATAPTNCATVTTNTVSYGGSAWNTNFYTVTSTSGNYITSNNNSAPACSACPTGWNKSAANATSNAACYKDVTLNKNGYSGSITAGGTSGTCTWTASSTTASSTLSVWYNKACTLPTISGFTQTGYTNSSAWSSSNAIAGTAITGISASTTAPADTIYVRKVSCAGNYYKNNTTTCSACSGLASGAYPKSVAGNNSDSKVCYADITLNKNGYSGTVTAPSNSGCEVDSNSGTNSANLHLHYNTACTLPTTTLTQTGYADTNQWSAANTIGASATATVAASTSAPSATTYYALKPGCVSPYYKSSTTACSACSSLTTPSSGWVTGGTYSSVSPYDANTTCRYKVADMATAPTNCSAVTTNTVSYGGSAWNTNFYTVTAKAGSYISSNNNSAPACTQCATGSYTASAGTQTSCSVCGSGTTTSGAGKTSCDATCSNNNDYDNAWATPAWNNNSPTGLCKITNCKSGSYYTSTNSGNTNTCTACADGSFMTSNGHTTTACTLCSSLTGVSPSGGTYSTGGNTGSTANTACKYTAPNKTITGCKTVTSQEVTYSGTAWPASTYGVTASKGYVIANNNKSNATCTACTGATYQSTDGSTATTCSACPSQTSGWTRGTGTAWTAVTSCYETQTPANCASGTIKHNATNSTTWGSNSVTSALSANANYYVNGTACSACSGLASGFYPNSNAGNTGGASACYTNTLSGKVVSSANASSATTCGAAYYKEPHTVNYGSTSSCSSCPSGYNANSATGKGAISQCEITCAAGNYMASGTYTRIEYIQTSGTQYIDTGLKAKSTMRAETVFKRTTGSGSPFGNYSDGGTGYNFAFWNAASTANCYTYNTANTKVDMGKKLDDTSWHTVILDYPAQSITVDGTTKAVTVNKTFTTSHNMPLFARYHTSNGMGNYMTGQMKSFVLYDNGTVVFNGVPVRRNSDNVLGMLDLVSGAFLTNAGTGTFTAGADVGPIGGTCSAVGSGYYAAATTVGYGSPVARSTCPTNYGNSASGASNINSCYLTTTATNYVASAGAGEVTCAANGYCPGGETIYYGGTHSASHMTTGGRSECTSPYTQSAAGSDDANDCYLTTTATKYVASTGAGETNCIANSYCPGGATIYVGGSVSGRDTTGGISTCSSGTNSKYTLSAAGTGSVNDCYLTTTATKYVATAGAGETNCVANSYCPGGVNIYYGGTHNASTHPTTGGNTACASPYTKSAVGSDDAYDCYLTTTSKKYVAEVGAGEVNCVAGGYCAGGATIYAGGSVSGRDTIGGIAVCAADTYSAASASSCTACTTAKGYHNSGNDYADHAGVASCVATCTGGQYVATAGAGCVSVGAGNWGAGGVVAQNATLARTACATGLTTIGYGAGADGVGDCGHKFHVGNDVLYLRSERRTTPSLNVKIGGTTFYGNMSLVERNMSDGADKKLKIKDNGVLYHVYDDSIGEEVELPSDYIQIPKITDNRNTYINTNLTVNDFDRVTARVKLYEYKSSSGSNDYPTLFGSTTGSSNGAQNAKTFRFYNKSSSIPTCSYGDTWASAWSTPASGSFPLNATTDVDIKLAAGEQYIKIDGVTKAAGTLTKTLTNNYKVTIFAMNYAGTTRYYPHLDCEGMKFYKGNEVVLDLIPVRKVSSNECGLYDVVNGTFYGGAVSGKSLCP